MPLILRHMQAGASWAYSLGDLADVRAMHTVTGAPTIVNSPLGKATRFDGANDYVTLVAQEFPLRFDSGTQDFSVCAWVKRNAWGAVHTVASKLDAADDGWVLFFTGTEEIAFSVDAVDIIGATAVLDGRWHHVAAVIDRDGNGQLYLDGAADGVAVAIGGEVMATTTAVRVGAESFGAAANKFPGDVHSIDIWPRILTPTEVAHLANGRSAYDYERHLISKYDMSTINPPDLGWRGNRYPGTGVNLVAADVVDGIAGGHALDFNGNNSHVNLGDVLELNTVSAFTIAFWMNQDVLDQNDYIFFKQVGDDDRLRINTTGGGILLVAIGNGSNAYGNFDYSTVIAPGSWHHFAAVFDGSQAGNANRLVIYVDGNPVVLAFLGTIPATTGPMVTDALIGGTSLAFNGKLDEFVILSAPLAQIQVNNLMIRQWQGRF